MKNKNKQATVVVIATTLSITPIISPLKVYAKDETADSSEVSDNLQEPTYTGDPYKIPIGNEKDSEVLDIIDSTPVNDQITDIYIAEAEVIKALDAYEFSNGTTEEEVEAYLKTMLVDSGKLGNIDINTYKITPATIDHAGHVEIKIYVYIVGQGDFNLKTYEADFPRLLNPGEMYINKDNFPDKTFREYVKNLEISKGNKDGILSQSEIDSITYISVYNMTTITSLKGIEHFTNLQSLNCDGTSIKELDVSANKNLTKLNCSTNSELISLNVTGAEALLTLDCQNTSIKALDVSENKNLTWLNCYGNLELTTLNVTGAEALQELYCHETSIKALDVSENKNLTWLYCFGNLELATLNVTGAEALQELQCFKTSIKALDVSENKNLTYLHCSDNSELISLNVTGAEALQELYCYNTSIKSLDVSENKNLTGLNCGNNLELANLNVTGAEALQELSCQKTSIRKLDVSENKNLTKLYCFDNSELISLNVTGAEALQTLYCYNTSIKSLDVSENKNLTGLNCGNNLELANLNVTGAEALQELSCQETSIQELDVSENKNLTWLGCFDNLELTTLNVTGAEVLQTLYCYNTSIKALDVSENKNLTNLDCYGNLELATLNVTGAEALQTLLCYKTSIKALDVSENKNLTTLHCYATPLTWLKLGDQKKLMDFQKSDSVIDLDITSSTFNINDVFNGIDTSKVTIISGGKLNNTTGLVSDYNFGTSIVYTYDCGKVNDQPVLLNVTLNIPKAYSTLEITSDLIVEYTGKPYQPTVKKTGSGGEVTYTYEIRSGESWIPYNQVPISVGEYRVQAHLAGDDHYEETVSEETVFEIVQANNAWITNLAMKNWEFKNTPNAPTASAKFGDITYAYSNEKDGAYTSAIPTQVGTYYVKATVAGTENYTGLEEVISFEISPKNVENSDRIIISEIKKEEDVKNLVIKDGDQVLEKGIDYDVEIEQEGNIVTVIITFKGNYTGTIKKTYKVNNDEPDKEVNDQPKEEPNTKPIEVPNEKPKEQPKVDEPKQKLKEELKADIIKDTGNTTSTGFLGAWGMILAGCAYVFTGKKKDKKHVD